MSSESNTIDQIRAFNRFYTIIIGTLNQRFLGTDYTLTQTRILFELHQQHSCNANALVNLLHIDKSYMSRIIRRFEQQSLIVRVPDPTDKRASVIQLTALGEKTVTYLIDVTNQQIGAMIASLDASQQHAVTDAMTTIMQLLK